MIRFRMALIGAALASAACGTAVITEQTSTVPSVVRSVGVATTDRGSVFARSGNFVAQGAVVKKVGMSRAPSPSSSGAPAPAKVQSPVSLPALANPCSRVGKASPMCPVAST